MTGGAIPVGGMLEPWGARRRRWCCSPAMPPGLPTRSPAPASPRRCIRARLAGEAAAAHRLRATRRPAPMYEEELEKLFGAALDRALRRRAELARSTRLARRPSKAALRRGWIAYPQYWASLAVAIREESANA